MTVLETILRGAKTGLDLIELALPHMTASGQIRIKSVIISAGEIIADEIERAKFGSASTKPPSDDGGQSP